MRFQLLLLWGVLFGSFSAYSQSITGTVTDAKTNETVIGANVVIKGTAIGTSTDIDGIFTLSVKDQTFPLEIEVSFLGYLAETITVNNPGQKIAVALKPNQEMLKTVEVIEKRLSEKQRKSALTVEALDGLAIKETPSVNFYEALGTLKGVDLTSASIGFKIVNTRGFNSTSPVRSLQLIDGVDNQAPGLNFALGNFLGSSELDIQNVDIIAGASTAFYGPGAFNGVIAMTTKDPFQYQGLSASVKVGERNLTQTAVRYAEAYSLFGSDRDNFAFKVNLAHLQADDWEAQNFNPVDQSEVGRDNPGGYDAVNVYGDESLASNNDASSYFEVQDNAPGLGIFFRPGYKEVDLVDYDTRNLKTNVELVYRTANDVHISLRNNIGTGTTVYQGENRFSLNNIFFMQNTLEVKKKDRFFARAYMTTENAGDSYDAVLTAFKMNDATLGNEADWNGSYRRTWVSRPFKFNEAFENAVGFQADTMSQQFFNNGYQRILDEYNGFLSELHDSVVGLISPNRIFPGTAAYDSLFNNITNRTFTNGGSKFFDESKLYHVMGEYQLHPAFADIRLGGNFRLYDPNSRGNIFDEIETVQTDSLGNITGRTFRDITNHEFGLYGGIEKQFFSESLKASFTLRMDKNENFDFLFSPAASAVYTINENHTVRFSAGRAIRNPTLQDQFLRYDVGRAILLGNIDGFKNLATLESFDFYRSQPQLQRDNIDFFDVDPIEPETVETLEIGYRGSLFKRLYIDGNYFYSWYDNFIGFQLGLDLKFDQNFPNRVTTLQAFRVSANARDLVTTQGLNIGLNYYLNDHLTVNGNYSWNKLNQKNTENPIIPAFNTPEHKFNLGLGGRNYKIWKNRDHKFSFNTNYKWLEGYQFEGSPQFTGFIDSYGMLDAQVSYRVPQWFSTFKLGASNLLNNEVFQVFGGPLVGRLAYFSITFENFDLHRKNRE